MAGSDHRGLPRRCTRHLPCPPGRHLHRRALRAAMGRGEVRGAGANCHELAYEIADIKTSVRPATPGNRSINGGLPGGSLQRFGDGGGGRPGRQTWPAVPTGAGR